MFKIVNFKGKSTKKIFFSKSNIFSKSKRNKSNSKSPRRSILFDKSVNSFIPKSPRELKEERIKKEQNMKKMMLLQEFEVSDDHKKDFVVHSPTTEAMKNSINTIKIDLKVDFKLYNEKFKNTNNLLIEDKKANLIKGKKPCARDGCSASIYNDKIIFFLSFYTPLYY